MKTTTFSGIHLKFYNIRVIIFPKSAMKNSTTHQSEVPTQSSSHQISVALPKEKGWWTPSMQCGCFWRSTVKRTSLSTWHSLIWKKCSTAFHMSLYDTLFNHIMSLRNTSVGPACFTTIPPVWSMCCRNVATIHDQGWCTLRISSVAFVVCDLHGHSDIQSSTTTPMVDAICRRCLSWKWKSARTPKANAAMGWLNWKF